MQRQLLDRLHTWKDHPRRKPLLIKGARQVGKTWLLQHFGSEAFPATHTINFEKDPASHSVFSGSLSPRDILFDLALLLQRDINPDDLLILDEIQACPRAVTALKYFAEERPEQALCAAGSHIGLTFADGSFPVGKIDILQLYPLSFPEYLQYRNPRLAALLNPPFTITDVAHELLWKEYLLYHYCGGLPEAVSRLGTDNPPLPSNLEQVRQYQTTLLESYLADFSKHAGGVNANHLTRIFLNIPVQLNQALDDSVSRFRFKGVIPDRSKYSQFSGPIDWLCHTGLALKHNQLTTVETPLKAHARENLFKLFYFDIGLLGAALSLSPRDILTQDYGSYKGFLAENAVIQALVPIGWPMGYWVAPSNRAEVECVIEHPELGLIPIEVKSGVKHRRSKSLSAYKQKYRPAVAVKLSGMNLRMEKDQINAPLYLAACLPELLSRWHSR